MISNTTLFEDNKISCLCFSPDLKYCAISLKSNNQILIFEIPQNNVQFIDKWILKKTLSFLDWSIKDKLLSGSHDRSLLIWQKKANPNNKLSILCGQWAPNGQKFAVGTSCKSVYIGCFNYQQNFWSGLLLKPKDKSIINSSIITLNFHKSGNLIAVGSADFSVRVITCSLANQNLETKADGTPFQGAYGNVTSFGEVLLSISNLQGWINHISFATDSNEIFVLPHNNSVVVLTIPESKDQQAVSKISNWKQLPLTSGFYINDNTYVAGGFDKNVSIFQKSPAGFQFVKNLDTTILQKSTSGEQKKGLVSGMKVMWDKQGLNKIDQRLSAHQTNSSVHKGPTILLKYGSYICSYDVNGVINFWQP